jgi:hypothetical protein
MGLIGILAVAGFCLVFGHLLLKEYLPIAALGAVGFVLVAGMLSLVLIFRRDVFAFVLVIYLASHFAYADNQGGLWNLLSFGLILAYLLFVNRHERIGRPDRILDALVVVFVLFNIAGWVVKNPVGGVPFWLGVASLFSFVLMFRLVNNLPLSPPRIRLFLLATAAILIYELLVGINQRYAFMNINTPLLGAYRAEHGAITYGSTNAQGTFRHSELFGEYGMLVLTLLIPFLCSSLTQRILNIRLITILVIAISSVAAILITSTRSAAILAVFVCFAYLLGFLIRPSVAIDAARRQLLLILLGIGFVVTVGTVLGTTSLGKDFADLAGEKFSMDAVTSGKAINRGGLFDFALKRIETESWIVGFGHGVPRSNLWAWAGADPERMSEVFADYHSLYLSLPMLYGWLGSAAFLSLILLTFGRTVSAAIHFRKLKSPLVVLVTGLSLFWFVFLIDQYKISILRTPGYVMMFWIWLGLSNAAVAALRREAKTVASGHPAAPKPTSAPSGLVARQP